MMLQAVAYDGDTILGGVVLTTLSLCGKKMMPSKGSQVASGGERIWTIGRSKYSAFVNRMISVSDEFQQSHPNMEIITKENLYLFFGLMEMTMRHASRQWALVLAEREYQKGDQKWKE